MVRAQFGPSLFFFPVSLSADVGSHTPQPPSASPHRRLSDTRAVHGVEPAAPARQLVRSETGVARQSSRPGQQLSRAGGAGGMFHWARLGYLRPSSLPRPEEKK